MAEIHSLQESLQKSCPLDGFNVQVIESVSGFVSVSINKSLIIDTKTTTWKTAEALIDKFFYEIKSAIVTSDFVKEQANELEMIKKHLHHCGECSDCFNEMGKL